MATLDPRIDDYLGRLQALSDAYRPSLFWENLLAKFRDSSGGKPLQRVSGAELEEMFRYLGYGFEELPRTAEQVRQDPRYLNTLKLLRGVGAHLKAARKLRDAREEWEHMYALAFLHQEGMLDEYLTFLEPFRVRSSMPVARFFYYLKTLLSFGSFLPPPPWDVLEIGAGAGNFACFLCRAGKVRNYVIIDLPEMLLHSSHMVVKHVPGASITFNDLSGFDLAAPGPKFYFVAAQYAGGVPDASFDLCLNFNSFMEMDGDVRDRYLAEVYRVGRPNAVFFNVNRRQRALPQRDGSTFDNNPLLFPYRSSDKVLVWEEDRFQQATRSWFLKVPSLAVTRIAVINPAGA
jgi:putative sugar O-methyltransferase